MGKKKQCSAFSDGSREKVRKEKAGEFGIWSFVTGQKMHRIRDSGKLSVFTHSLVQMKGIWNTGFARICQTVLPAQLSFMVSIFSKLDTAATLSFDMTLGIDILNTEPFPGSDSTSIDPPCCSQIWFERNNPNPVPLFPFEEKNRVNIFSLVS